MSYQERRAIVSILSTILISAIYFATMIPRFPEWGTYSAEVFHFWGSFFLLLILVSIVAKIIIYIVFSILHTIATREDEPSIVDERDKLVGLKALRNSSYSLGVGMLLAMGSLVIGMPPSAMFLILSCSSVITQVISDLSEFYFYQRGV
jgi:hypothetical protein